MAFHIMATARTTHLGHLTHVTPLISSTRNIVKRVTRKNNGSRVLIAIPLITFGLGCWQVKRRSEKLELIDIINRNMHGDPMPVPSPADHDELEYTHVRMPGYFDHSRELHLFPRAATKSGDYGTNVITPFRRKDTGEWVLVNRGWVPNALRNPAMRQAGQTKGEIILDAHVRKGDQGNVFVNNNPKDNQWFYRDVHAMSSKANTTPYLFDASEAMTPTSGFPIGGQTRVDIRNEHMQYIVTWFSLSFLTSILCYRMFVMKKPPALVRRKM
eukprot:CFRG0617T1